MKNLYLVTVTCLFLCFVFPQKLNVNEKDVEVNEHVSVDTIEPKRDTLKMDTLYEGGRDSYMHFRPYNPRPDTVYMKLVLDDTSYSPPIGGKKTSGYGWRWGRMHEGIDMGYNNRDTALSTFDGVVRWSRYGYNGGYGNLVVMRHPNGLETYYAHFRKLLVEEGDTIESGTPIGIIGSTGRSGGPHLHYEMRFLGASINPELLINFEDFTLRYDSVVLIEEHGRYILK